MRTGLGIGEGVVVCREVVAAICCHGVQLVVGQLPAQLVP